MMVVTVTQRTQNDMTSWCADVEQEREQMLDKVSCRLVRTLFYNGEDHSDNTKVEIKHQKSSKLT